MVYSAAHPSAFYSLPLDLGTVPFSSVISYEMLPVLAREIVFQFENIMSDPSVPAESDHVSMLYLQLCLGLRKLQMHLIFTYIFRQDKISRSLSQVGRLSTP